MDVVKRQLAQNQVSQAAGPAPTPTGAAGDGMAGIADYLKNGGTPPPAYLQGQPTPPGMPGAQPLAQQYPPSEQSQMQTLPNQYGPNGEPLAGQQYTLPMQPPGTPWGKGLGAAQTTAPTNWANEAAGLGPSPLAYSSPQGSVGTPTGPISTPGLQIAFGRGGSWDQVNAYDPAFVEAGARYGVDPAMLKAMMVVESGGQNIPNQNGYPNFGPMQLTSVQFGADEVTKWDNVATKLGLDITNPEHQVEIAAYVLGGHDGDAGTPEEIFLNQYYPIAGGPDVIGPDGHTQNQYRNDMHLLMADINAADTGGAVSQPGGVAPGSTGMALGDVISQPGGAVGGSTGGGLAAPGMPGGAAPAPEAAPSTTSAPVETTTTWVDPSTGQAMDIKSHPVQQNAGYPAGSGLTTIPDNPDGTRSLDPKFIVLHYTASPDSGFVNGWQASSNYIVEKDGTIVEVIDPNKSPWTNGDADIPHPDATPGTNMNQESLTIEIVNEGCTNHDDPATCTAYTPEQIEATNRLVADLAGGYGITPEHVIGHEDVTSSKGDPGPLWDMEASRQAGGRSRWTGGSRGPGRHA